MDIIEELEISILKWLAHDPKAQYNPTLAKIVNEIATSNDYLNKIKSLSAAVNRVFDNTVVEVNKDRLTENVQFALQLLKAQNYITSNEFEVFYNSERIVDTNYAITKFGRANLKKIVLNGRMTTNEFRALNATLEFINSYGIINFNALDDIVKETDISYNQDIMRGFLLDNGFISVITYDPIYTTYCLSDKGRKLKECGSYFEYLEQEKDEKDKANDKAQLEYNLMKSQHDFQQINNDFISKQAELIDNQIQTNKNVAETNKDIVSTNSINKWILKLTTFFAFSGVVVSIVSVVVTLKLEPKKDQLESLQQQLQNSRQDISQLQNTLTNQKRISDSLMSVLLYFETKKP